MADLIDRAGLLAEIQLAIEDSGCVNHERDMMDCIRYAPPIDAVAVVRCQECKHSGAIPANKRKYVPSDRVLACACCRGDYDIRSDLSLTWDDGYCDEGERMIADAPERGEGSGQ